MKISLAILLFFNFASFPDAWADGKENYQTTMDFDSTMIDGKMKAPSGFFLQGRNKQSLTNLVKLRSNFKPQLKDSKAAVKSLVK